VECADGRLTLREAATGRWMHSAIGPEAEARAIYRAQSELGLLALERADAEPLVVWDVGLGIAANSLAVLQAWPGPRRLEVWSFESDPAGLRAAWERRADLPWLARPAGAVQALLGRGEWDDGASRWRLLTGDFRARMEDAPAPNLIHFDLYAPESCPELWSVDVFAKLRERAAPGARLVTYAAATPVRTALWLAGWRVGPGSATTLKRETTLAVAPGGTLPQTFGAEWLAKWERSLRWRPYGGEGLSREEVRARLTCAVARAAGPR
jgi:queuine tRNA-ribosyltransferase